MSMEVVKSVNGVPIRITDVALRKVEEGKFLVVVYKEISEKDGFIITAYFTSKMRLEREVIVWQR